MRNLAKSLAVLGVAASVALPMASAFAAAADGEHLGEGRPVYNVRRGMYEKDGGADSHVRPGMYKRDGEDSRKGS